MSKQNFQEIAQSASNYRLLSAEKVLTKRRGRACTRNEKRGISPDQRILSEQMSLSSALKEYSKEKAQFEKLMKEVGSRGIADIEAPPFLSELKQKAQLAKGNLKSAEISRDAMAAVPPLT